MDLVPKRQAVYLSLTLSLLHDSLLCLLCNLAVPGHTLQCVSVWSELCERLLLVPTWGSLEMAWESPLKPQILWCRRAQNLSLWIYSHHVPIRQRINIFCQPCFGDDKWLPGEVVGLAHTQTESLRKSKELPPNYLNLAQKKCIAAVASLSLDEQQFHATLEIF